MTAIRDRLHGPVSYGIVDYFSGSKLWGTLDEYLKRILAAGNTTRALKFFEAAALERNRLLPDPLRRIYGPGDRLENGGMGDRPRLRIPGEWKRFLLPASASFSLVFSVLFHVVIIVLVVVLSLS